MDREAQHFSRAPDGKDWNKIELLLGKSGAENLKAADTTEYYDSVS